MLQYRTDGQYDHTTWACVRKAQSAETLRATPKVVPRGPTIMSAKGTLGTAMALRVWGYCLAIHCLASTSAVACTPATERGIFFEHVPANIDAPVIIEATIYGDGSQVGDVAGNQMIIMNARVDRVIKGPIDAKTLKIFVYLGACTRVGVGQGIVLGELRDDPLRGPMLEAIEGANFRSESKEFQQKQEAIWAAVTHDK